MLLVEACGRILVALAGRALKSRAGAEGWAPGDAAVGWQELHRWAAVVLGEGSPSVLRGAAERMGADGRPWRRREELWRLIQVWGGVARAVRPQRCVQAGGRDLVQAVHHCPDVIFALEWAVVLAGMRPCGGRMVEGLNDALGRGSQL